MGSVGLPETCYASRLWLWPGHAVYIGPSLGLDPHSGSVSCLAVALDGRFTVRTTGAPGPEVSTALIPPRLTHQVVAESERMAFCFLDGGSMRHRTCRSAMTATDGEIAYRHRHEHALAAAGDLDEADSARAWLDLATGPGTSEGNDATHDRPRPIGASASGARDPRMQDAIAALHDLAPCAGVTATHLAAVVGLSPSRFLHLFRHETGTSFRRYRLWLRMLRAAELLRDRAELTTAATDAGFASPSHFSDSFHAMFGLRPSHLLGSEIRLADHSTSDVRRPVHRSHRGVAGSR